MNSNDFPVVVHRLEPSPSPDDLRQLASLLVETVRDGAAVSFLDSLTDQDAQDWWRRTIGSLHPRGFILVARRQDLDGRILGTVQLHPAWAPNQPGRAEVAKLMVHPGARGLGIARRLMVELEQLAADAGYTLLTLDTKTGTPAERLYGSLGWTCVGVIPRFALDPDGRTHHDATIFYKHLAETTGT